MYCQPLTNEDKDAGLRLVQIIHRTHPVQVAFWLKSDNKRWRLYIGGDWVEFLHSKEAYKVVLKSIDDLNDPNIDISRTAVIPMSHSLAKSAMIFWQKYPDIVPSWSKDSKFGEADVKCVYLYPINDEWNQNPELPLRLIENIETNLKYSVEVFSVEDLIEHLLIWHGTFRDAPDNFDAKLLKKAARVLQEQWDRIGELEDMLDLKNT